MKTAMQILLEILESKILPCDDDYSYVYGMNVAHANIIYNIKNGFLEKEKEQLQKAFSDGQETPLNHPTLPHYSRDEYYIDNYNQKELIIVDFDKVKEEWIKEANGMTELEKVKYYFKKINDNQNK